MASNMIENHYNHGRYIISDFILNAPDNDFDLTIKFSNGKIVQIQARPSNADEEYNGSLDIILPENQWVLNWEGDDMKPSKGYKSQPENRFAKQLVTELP